MTDNRDDKAAHSCPKALPSDDIDDLFDYDVGLDEVLRDVDTKSQAANADTHKPSATAASGASLGLDEEVKVSKRRQPIAKLDEACLLSRSGIPKLRSSAKAKLKFKGKGHEFQDAARLLNFYQLWLDDLFPRAKFADGLAIIEKLGHSKRIQIMRREWIDEDKPKMDKGDNDSSQKFHSLDRSPNALQLPLDNPMTDSDNRMQTMPQSEMDILNNGDGQPMKDNTSSLINGVSTEERHLCEGSAREDGEILSSADDDGRKDVVNGTMTVDDDLEALLVEEGANMGSGRPTYLTETHARSLSLNDNFDDDIEAMRELQIPQ